MKQLLLIVLFISTLFPLCTKDFINLPSPNAQTVNNFFKDTSAYFKAVVANYNNLEGLYSNYFPTILESRSDNVYHGNVNAGGGIQSSIQLFGEQTTNTYLSGTYTGLYNMILNSNLILDALQTASISGINKTNYIGEASFCRALAYFNLVRLWGGVPIITNAITNITEADNVKNVARSSAKEVYNLIIADLNTAINNLPVSYPNATTNTNFGRINKEAATALLGKVYLTMQDWGNAVTTLKSAISLHIQNNKGKDSMMLNGSFRLNGTSVFTNSASAATQEVILAINYAANLTSGGNFLNAFNSVFKITADLQSKTFTIIPDDRESTTSAPRTPATPATPLITKLPTTSSTNQANAFPLIRYSDVLLMLAEALNEQAYSSASGVTITSTNYSSLTPVQSATQTAYDLINRVRLRAGMTTLLTEANLDANINPNDPVSATTNQEKLRKYIFEERRREFCYEMLRWFDIIRYGTGGIDSKTGSPVTSLGFTILQKYVPSATVNRLLYAIPQQEIDVHNNPSTFPQNAGY